MLAAHPDIAFTISGTLNAVSSAVADPTTSRVPLPGRVVYLDLNDDDTLDAGDPSTVTAADGSYSLPAPGADSYFIRIVTLPGEGPVTRFGGIFVGTVDAGHPNDVETLDIVRGIAIQPIAPVAAPFGGTNPDVATAEVVGLYRLLFDRAPDAPGGAAAVAYLKAGGSLQTLTYFLMQSDEYQTDVIRSYFEGFFGRVPIDEELTGWLRLIREQKLTDEQVAFDFLSSDSFSTFHEDNASFITALYADVLGRVAVASDIAAWDAVLDTGVSRATMVSDLMHSTYAAQRSADQFASLFWDTTLSPADEAYVVDYLVAGGTLVDVASAFATLPGFVNRAKATVA